MKKHQNLYIVGAIALVIGGYLYYSKKKNDSGVNLTPPEVAEDSTTTGTTTPSTSNAGSTLGGISQVLDSIKGIIGEIKTKAKSTTSTTSTNVADFPINRPI